MSIGYSTLGNGPMRLLILHGWLSDGTVYDSIKPFFDPTKYSIAFMDFRGYGQSKGLSGDYTIDEIASDALSLADTLSWDTFHVIGHSMGGVVLQKMALLAPTRILSGIAITPVPASGFDLGEEGTAFFQSSATDDHALNTIFNTLTGQQHSNAFLSYMTENTRKSTSTPAYLGYLAAWTGADFADQVSQIDVPICVIAGHHDGALGPNHMRETYLKQLSNVKMDVIEGAGHYPMLETPPELFKHIEAFLNEQI